jgi:hypothetical protein
MKDFDFKIKNQEEENFQSLARRQSQLFTEEDFQFMTDLYRRTSNSFEDEEDDRMNIIFETKLKTEKFTFDNFTLTFDNPEHEMKYFNDFVGKNYQLKYRYLALTAFILIEALLFFLSKPTDTDKNILIYYITLLSICVPSSLYIFVFPSIYLILTVVIKEKAESFGIFNLCITTFIYTFICSSYQENLFSLVIYFFGCYNILQFRLNKAVIPLMIVSSLSNGFTGIYFFVTGSKTIFEAFTSIYEVVLINLVGILSAYIFEYNSRSLFAAQQLLKDQKDNLNSEMNRGNAVLRNILPKVNFKI